MRAVKEIICVVLLVAFVFMLSKGYAESTKTAEEMFESVKAAACSDGLKKCTKAQFKKETGFSENEFESVVYYASDSVMEVREVMIVKLGSADGQALVQKLKENNEKKAELFKGYAPKQSALLESYVLTEKAGFVFYAVCDEPQKAVAEFNKNL